MPEGERRFEAFDDEEELPRRWPWWLAGGVVVLGLAAAVLVVVVHAGGHSHPTANSSTAAARLPANAHPLPGETVAPERAGIGVLGPADPAHARVSRAAAIRDYRRIPGAASESGRRVLAALVRVAYFDDAGAVRRSNVWVVSVWYHPGYTQSRYQWCVDHGFVNATTGRPSGHTLLCPLPPGYNHPRPVT